jgi:phosphinothricin acetyltransferase
MQLRDATPGDLTAITAIYAHHVLHGTGTFEEVPPSRDDMSIRLAKGLANRFDWLVAVEPDPATGRETILGYGYTGAFRERSAYRFTVEDSLYVHHEHVGRGVGRLLLAELVRRSEQAGARRMLAVIGDSANAGSIGVHAGAGFRHCGTMPAVGWKFDRWLDVVLMERDLGAGSSIPPTAVGSGHG